MSDSGYPPSEYSDSLHNNRREISKSHGNIFQEGSLTCVLPSSNSLQHCDYDKLRQFPGYKIQTHDYSDYTGTNLQPNENHQLDYINREEFQRRPRPRSSSLYQSEFNNMIHNSPRSKHPPYGVWHGHNAEKVTPQRRLSPSMFNKKQQDNVSDDSRKQAQMQAYIAWVNVQLKKRAGTRHIEDLATDLRDGTALIHLIHIVADEELSDVQLAPGSRDEMIHNISRVLEFMRSRHIRMHHTAAEDIVDGNVKAIMRLILALAAHFKPNSVKQSSHSASNRAMHDSMAAIAQGAAAALADARKDANRTSQRPRRPKHLLKSDRHSARSGSDSDDAASSQPSNSLPPRLGVTDGASSVTSSHGASPRSHVTASPRHATRPYTPSRAQTALFLPKSKSTGFRDGEPAQGETDSMSESFVGELSKEHTELQREMDHTKSTLLILQELLLSGRIADGAESSESHSEQQEVSKPATGSTRDEEMVILRSKLQHSEEVCKQLKQQVSSLRQETMQLQGVKAGLQQRLSEQDHSFLVMKAELLRAGFAQQALDTAKVDLEKKLEEKDSLVLNLRRDLAKREREIDELKANFQVDQQNREATARALRAQISDLHNKLQRVGETEATLSARVASQDRKMARLEGKIMASSYDSNTGSTRGSSCRSTHSASSDEIQSVRDNLHTLRTHFHGNESQHHAIDALETSIATLMERLQQCDSRTGSSSTPSDQGNMSHAHVTSQGNMTSQGMNSSIASSSQPHRRYSGSPSFSGQGPAFIESPFNGNQSTKVLYFTDRAVTPFMVTLPKRLGEITLGDIKAIVERPGSYRYHFKAMDPEFGTVKEEVLHDEDIVPGWEGKIVAWIEEDHG